MSGVESGAVSGTVVSGGASVVVELVVVLVVVDDDVVVLVVVLIEDVDVVGLVVDVEVGGDEDVDEDVEVVAGREVVVGAVVRPGRVHACRTASDTADQAPRSSARRPNEKPVRSTPVGRSTWSFLTLPTLARFDRSIGARRRCRVTVPEGLGVRV